MRLGTVPSSEGSPTAPLLKSGGDVAPTKYVDTILLAAVARLKTGSPDAYGRIDPTRFDRAAVNRALAKTNL
jgi:hypothetical protein